MTFPLDPEAFTALHANTIDEDALQMLLDAAEEEILDRVGRTIDAYAVTDRTETFSPNGSRIMLGERALSISAVREHVHAASPTTLADDDYELSPSGYILRRLISGTHGSSVWRPLVAVTYVPWSDTATRSRVQAELVKLSIAFNPGLSAQTIGSWHETYTASGVPYDQQRAAILATLASDPVAFF